MVMQQGESEVLAGDSCSVGNLVVPEEQQSSDMLGSLLPTCLRNTASAGSCLFWLHTSAVNTLQEAVEVYMELASLNTPSCVLSMQSRSPLCPKDMQLATIISYEEPVPSLSTLFTLPRPQCPSPPKGKGKLGSLKVFIKVKK